jgi:hypothetical protein
MDNLQQALAGIDQERRRSVAGLAIEIANQVLRQSLRLQPELILPVVREAVTTLHPHHGQPLLFVHPDDAALVRSHLGEQLAHMPTGESSTTSTLTPAAAESNSAPAKSTRPSRRAGDASSKPSASARNGSRPDMKPFEAMTERTGKPHLRPGATSSMAAGRPPARSIRCCRAAT